MKRAALHNLGCKVNAYETEAMRELLEQAGYQIVDFKDQADVYVVNTCTVTNIADRKSRQMLHQAKKRNPQAVVVATGCYVQTSDIQGKKDDAIDIYIGTNEKARLVEAIEEYNSLHNTVTYISDMEVKQDYEELQVKVLAEHSRAFVKVQDGCNQFCSYCIIPYARGRIRSSAMDLVLEEIRNLAAAGYKEVVLTGIHLASYQTEDGQGLMELIEAVHDIEGIERIRFGSLEPGFITEDTARRLGALDKVCPHFHLSLQSGCDTVLKRMNRHYTSGEYLEKCNLLRLYFDDPAFTTDIIVGFPGETEEEFQTTLDFVREVGFYEVHVFKYSMRQGTVAARRPDQVEDSLKQERSEKLIALAAGQKEAYEEAHLNRETSLLTEEEVQIEGKTYYKGHSPQYMECFIDAEGRKSGEIYCGKLCKKDKILYIC